MRKSKRVDRVDHQRAAILLRDEWKAVVGAAESKPAISFIDKANLCDAIATSINHNQFSYRYCSPIQLLGKLTNPGVHSRRLQRDADDSDPAAWDARSLGSKVIAPFINEQESVLGTSGDPYVENPMRIPITVGDVSPCRVIPFHSRNSHGVPDVRITRCSKN